MALPRSGPWKTRWPKAVSRGINSPERGYRGIELPVGKAKRGAVWVRGSRNRPQRRSHRAPAPRPHRGQSFTVTEFPGADGTSPAP